MRLCGPVVASDGASAVLDAPHSALDEYYLRAVQADADNATILRQFPAYERSYRAFGREGGDTSAPGVAATDVHHDTLVTSRTASCRLCRVIRACEICEFNAHTKALEGQPPTRAVGDRLGLKVLLVRRLRTQCVPPLTRAVSIPRTSSGSPSTRRRWRRRSTVRASHRQLPWSSSSRTNSRPRRRTRSPARCLRPWRVAGRLSRGDDRQAEPMRKVMRVAIAEAIGECWSHLTQKARERCSPVFKHMMCNIDGYFILPKGFYPS